MDISKATEILQKYVNDLAGQYELHIQESIGGNEECHQFIAAVVKKGVVPGDVNYRLWQANDDGYCGEVIE